MTDSTHHQSSRSIWVFTPSRTAPEDLEAILVQRHDLLQDAVERVRESALTANKHHLLFVGPRGCGKTHLITLIVSRISADQEASEHLRLAWLNEDETCTSLLELLIKIHVALEKRYPEEFHAEDLAAAYELKPEQAQDFIASHLLTRLGSRTLAVVTENLDALFESMGEKGQKQLRAFIQEHPQFAFIATAQRLVDDLSDRSSPFFGFFQTEHLKPLSVEQAATLLQNIARVQGKKEVIEFLATGRGRSRVRALHHLSGGNHRIYIVLSQFITQETLDSLIGPFLKMVDELTPYYQERVRWLPPLQRKIVELLCTCEGTVPVKEIAKRLFSTPQTISSQLQDLREKGYVESHQRGRESLYEVSEPLMRICVEVKENQNTQPLRLLVDFLRVWYDDVELKRRLGLCLPESYSYHYISAALRRNDEEGNLRMRFLIEEIMGKESIKVEPNFLKQVECIYPEELFIALQCQKAGDLDGAIKHANDVIGATLITQTKALGLFALGNFLEEKGDEVGALMAYTAIVQLNEVTPGVSSNAYYNRAALNFKHGNFTDVVVDVTNFIQLNDLEKSIITIDQVDMSVAMRGYAHFQQGHFIDAIEDFSRCLDTTEIPELITLTLQARGKCFASVGKIESAIADFNQILKLADVSLVKLAETLLCRGSLHAQAGESVKAIADYTRVVELRGAPADLVADALLFRASRYRECGNNTAEVGDYNRVIAMLDAKVDQVAKALISLGISQFERGDSISARKNLESVILLDDAPVQQIAKAHFCLAELHFIAGRWNEGFDALESALNLGAQQSPPNLQAPVDIISILFAAGLSQEGRRDQATRMHTLYASHGALAVLGEALVKHVGSLLNQDPRPSSDNLDQWLAAWTEAAGDAPEFKLPLRLLRTGVDFIKAGGKDEGILLNLTTPERSILRQALGLDSVDD